MRTAGPIISAGWPRLPPGATRAPPDPTGRDWLTELGPVQQHAAGWAPDSPVLGWAATRPLSPAETGRLRETARFAAAPLAALAGRVALSALLEAYLGRRSAARVQAGALRRGTGEAIRAALLCAHLRDFTMPSEATEPTAMTGVLPPWFAPAP